MDRAARGDDGAVRGPGGRRDRVQDGQAPRGAAGSQPPPRNPLWDAATRDGLADPELREAAAVCFAAAAEALPRLGASSEVRDAVAAYTDRYVARGRCPADDVLDLFHGKDIPA